MGKTKMTAVKKMPWPELLKHLGDHPYDFLAWNGACERSESWGTCAVGDALCLREYAGKRTSQPNYNYAMEQAFAQLSNIKSVARLHAAGREFTHTVLANDTAKARRLYNKIQRQVGRMNDGDRNALLAKFILWLECVSKRRYREC